MSAIHTTGAEDVLVDTVKARIDPDDGGQLSELISRLDALITEARDERDTANAELAAATELAEQRRNKINELEEKVRDLEQDLRTAI